MYPSLWEYRRCSLSVVSADELVQSIDKYVSSSYSPFTTPIDSTVGSRPPYEAVSVFVITED